MNKWTNKAKEICPLNIFKVGGIKRTFLASGLFKKKKKKKKINIFHFRNGQTDSGIAPDERGCHNIFLISH